MHDKSKVHGKGNIKTECSSYSNGITKQFLTRGLSVPRPRHPPPKLTHQKKTFEVTSKTGSSSSKAPHSIAWTLEVLPLAIHDRTMPTSIARLVRESRRLCPRSSRLDRTEHDTAKQRGWVGSGMKSGFGTCMGKTSYIHAKRNKNPNSHPGHSIGFRDPPHQYSSTTNCRSYDVIL